MIAMRPTGGILLFTFAFLVRASRSNTFDNTYYSGGVGVRSDFGDGSTTEANHYSLICMDIRPQHSVDIKQILGLWYGIEIIVHTQDVPGVFKYDSCVIIHLADVTEQMPVTTDREYSYSNNNNNNRRYSSPSYEHRDTKYLRLVWSEADENLVYTLNYTTHSPGLWHNIEDQRGTLASLKPYEQFRGSVQVVKAVNDHLVLTFCGSDISSRIYTVVLSRDQLGLGQDELRSIRNLLSRRGLHTATIRKVCVSAGMGLKTSMLLVCLLLGIMIIVRKLY